MATELMRRYGTGWKRIGTQFLLAVVFASVADSCRRLNHWSHCWNLRRPGQVITEACLGNRESQVSICVPGRLGAADECRSARVRMARPEACAPSHDQSE